jgi:hypothetical protein
VHGANGSAANPSFAFNSDQNTGIYRIGLNNIGVAANGNKVLDIATTGLTVTGALGASSLTAPASNNLTLAGGSGNTSVILTPSGTGFSVFGSTAANTAYLGASPVATTSYGLWLGQTSAGSATYSLLSNGSRLIVNSPALAGGILFAIADTEVARFHATTGRLGIGTGSTDSGALLQVGTNTTTSAFGMVFGTDTFLYRLGNGNLAVAGTTNPSFSYYAGSNLIGYFSSVAGSTTIATAGAGSPSLIFKSGNEVTALTLDSSQQALFAGNVSLATGRSILFGGGTISNIYSTTDGIIVIANNANTGFNRLCFGGTTASFPALKRNGTALEVRLADDSSHAAMFVSTLGFGALGTFTGAADGVFLMRDNAATSFGRLQFGGTTSSFPALKRDGTAITVKLADDSAYASFAANSLAAVDGITAPGGSVGFARIYVDSADGDLKVVFGDGVVKTLATDT